mgnify:CR=1 FL=1
MSELVPLPCPFCGWENIRIVESPFDNGFFKDSLYTYCWCKVCGTRGPWAFNVEDADEENYHKCIVRWNERNGKNGVKQKNE